MAGGKTLKDVFQLLKSEVPGSGTDAELLDLPLRSYEWATWYDVAQVIASTSLSPDAIITQLRTEFEHRDAERRFQGARTLFWMAQGLLAEGVGEHGGWLESFASKHIADRNEDLRVRCYLIRFAGFIELAPEAMVPGVAPLLRDKEALIRSSAILALADYGPTGESVWPKIIDQLRNESTAEVWQALDQFIEEASIHEWMDQQFVDRLVPLLVQKVSNAEADIKRTAIEILGNLGERAVLATGALSEVVLDNDVSVACSAANALGNIGRKAGVAVPSLIKARHREGVSWAADDALSRIDPAKHATLKLEEAMVDGSDAESVRIPDAFFLGSNKVQIGSKPPLNLAENEGNVVEALVELGAADQFELADRSGVNQPGRILKRIIDKHPLLSAYIILPGGKGKGGYRTTIKRRP